MTEIEAATRFVVTGTGNRVDRLIAAELGLGRRRARELVELGYVRVDGHRVRSGTVAHAGSVVELRGSDVERPIDPAPTEDVREKPRIVWRDGSWIAVFKPVGYHSVRGRGRPCIADFLAGGIADVAGADPFTVDAGLVHRLDRDTCGVLLATTESDAYFAARRAFAAGEILKEYLVLVVGRLVAPQTIDTPLSRRKTRVRPARRGERARPAVTELVPLEGGSSWTLVTATMRTGVTHQIRAHLALAGYPVLGDSKYGAPRWTAPTHQLHARRITLPDGRSVTTSPGVEFLEMLARLRRGFDPRDEEMR